MRRRTTFISTALVLLASASTAATAHGQGDERAQCVQAADLAQQNRDEGKYRTARENMLTCSRDTCPQAVRRDCAVWLTELDASAPTLVFSAKFGANDAADVRVKMDDTVLTERLDGKPIMVDPGEHKFTFERAGRSEQQTLVVQAGQKNRQVQVTFADPNAPKPKEVKSESGRSIPVMSFVLAGVALVGVGGFVGFGLAGKGEVDDMRKPVGEGGCAPSCSQDRVDSAKSKLLLADISVGVGIAALAAAGAVYFLTPADGAPKKAGAWQPRFDASITPQGATSSLKLSF